MNDAVESRIRNLLRGGLLSHPLFVREAVDAGSLGPAAIGRLIADALRVNEEDPAGTSAISLAAASVLHRANTVGQRHTEETALAVLNAAFDVAGRDFNQPLDNDQRQEHWAAERTLQYAERAITGLDGNITSALRAAVAALASLPYDAKPRPVLLALAGIAGEPVLSDVLRPLGVSVANSPIYAAQLRLVAETGVRDGRQALEAARSIMTWSDAQDDDDFAPPGEHPLAQIDAFAAASLVSIEQAAQRLAAIRSGEIPFAADKAFALEDAHALARYVNLSLDRNEPWLVPMLEPLLLDACIAPGNTAKSAPSQALAIGIAKAIVERPTARSLLVLSNAKAAVRHAGLKKKFDRLLLAGQRRLAARPDFILQLPPDYVPPKALLPVIRASFEALYRSGLSVDFAAFEASVLGNASLAKFASGLIWRLGDSRTARPIKTRAGWRWCDVDGQTIATAPDDVVTLWHPLGDETEAERWRGAIVDSAVEQPFNQAFRETYALDGQELLGPRTAVFAGHAVDAKVLTGVALTTGWRLSRHGNFKMTAGDYQFWFDCGELYPGAAGSTSTGYIRASKAGRDVSFGEIAPVLISEVLRQADLLTSVAAFALDADDRLAIDAGSTWGVHGERTHAVVPGGRFAQRRRQVLIRLFGVAPRSDAPWVDDRYLCVRDVRIHIATGHARRDGKALTLDAASAAVALPYSDAVLQKIVAQANVILSGAL